MELSIDLEEHRKVRKDTLSLFRPVTGPIINSAKNCFRIRKKIQTAAERKLVRIVKSQPKTTKRQVKFKKQKVPEDRFQCPQ